MTQKRKRMRRTVRKKKGKGQKGGKTCHWKVDQIADKDDQASCREYFERNDHPATGRKTQLDERGWDENQYIAFKMTKSDWLEDGGTNILQLLKCPKCKKRSINYSCSRGMAATCFYFCENQDCLSLIAAGGAVGIADAASTAGKVGSSIATGGLLGFDNLDIGSKVVGVFTDEDGTKAFGNAARAAFE